MLIKDILSAAAGRSTKAAVPLFWWQGWSSRWYVTSVLDLEGFSCRDAGVFIVARQEADGQRTPLMVGTADNVSDELFKDYGEPLMRAIKAGAREVHVHLAATDPAQREAAMQDVAAGWSMPAIHPRVYA
jgi:hypothetical protein